MRNFSNLLVAVLLFALTLAPGTGIHAHFPTGDVVTSVESEGDPVHI